jgi:hypothetical protein
MWATDLEREAGSPVAEERRFYSGISGRNGGCFELLERMSQIPPKRFRARPGRAENEPEEGEKGLFILGHATGKRRVRPPVAHTEAR